MNVLYNHRTQGKGAEGVHIAHVIKSLREIGHQVGVTSPNDSDPTNGLDTSSTKVPGFKAHFLDFLSRILPQIMFELMEIAYNLSASSKIKSYLANNKVDLIYERYGFFMWAGARLAKKNNLPYIVEVNEIAGEERVRKQLLVNFSQKIEREVFETADAIIVVSNFLKKKIADLGVEPDKIYVIPNAADPEMFDPNNCKLPVRQGFDIPDDATVLGFVGSLVAWHNFDLLIESVSKLKDENVYLMLVGDGVLLEDLKEQAKLAGCSDRVIFPGAVKHTAVPEYINAMDICIIPGSNDYRSPIKLFEYMIMGKATVAPRLEPIEFIVKDGEQAKLFEQGNQASFIDAVMELVKDKDKQVKIGQDARKLTQEKHLWSHNAQRVIDIYDSIKN
ncbi:MAG: glycosyltransferase family 4 protein [Pseudomonadales bacterium]|nr:glycosyltransferase family 4 protein [Pseudomonadales bacterium]